MATNDPLPGNIKDDPNFWPLFKSTRYIDKDGSPEQSLFFDRGQLNRPIYIAHSYLYQALLDFAGSVSVINNGTSRALSRDLPHNYGLKRPWMWVQGVNSVTPLGSRARNPEGNTLADFQGRDIDDTPLYKVAEVSLQYVMPTFKFRTDDDIRIVGNDLDPMDTLPDEGQAIASGYANSRYITRYSKYQTKILTIPRGFLKQPDGTSILENVAVNEHVGEFVYVWHQVPEEGLPTLLWGSVANVVNDAVFDGRPVGTLAFSGDPEIRPNPSPLTGQMLYDVTYHFQSRMLADPDGGVKGWNYLIKPLSGSLKPILMSASGGATPAQSALMFKDFDFRKFFRPDPL